MAQALWKNDAARFMKIKYHREARTVDCILQPLKQLVGDI
jgi:hypothetical protein